MFGKGLLLCLILLAWFPLTGWAEEPPLPKREFLRYRISYSAWMTLGFSTLSIDGPCPAQPHCLQLSTRATSAEWLEYMFKIDDRVVSHWDTDQRRTLFSHKDLNEGKTHKEYLAHFDYEADQVTWEQKGYSKNTTEGMEQGQLKELPPELQDPLSAVFFARSHLLAGQPGMSFTFSVFDDLKISQIKMDILAEEEVTLEINGEKRTYMAHKIRPHYTTSGLFERAGRKLFIWVMKDRPRIPLKFRAEIAVGSILVELVEARPLPEGR